ncbi:MAG: hypothetical protein JNL57_10445 [Bacteroidetes bacterium]|nr:hypothetical protein [Bacteroidota bacterium]
MKWIPKTVCWLLCCSGMHVARSQGFFQMTTYKGAFGATDWTQTWTNWNPRNTSYPASTITVQGSITGHTTWTASNTYLLKGYVYVKNGATLTIEPGTIIRCEDISTSTLIITRGSKIIAEGTAALPIVFTSSQSAGSRNYGDWGGLVILGNARINAAGGTADVGAGINNTQGDGLYGGNDDEDSSGVLKYVRVEFPGIQYQPDKEINGVTLAGVGSRTKIDYLQVSFCGNDALKLSGGVPKIRHFITHRTYDSDIACDLGCRGMFQFGVVLRDSSKANATGASSLEVQNDGLATAASPMTDPTFSNLTLLGPLTSLTTPYSSNYRYGIHLRRNGRMALFNSAIAGYPRGIMLDGPGCGNQMKDGKIFLQNSVFAGNKIKMADTTGKVSMIMQAFDFAGWITDATRANATFNSPKDLKLANPYQYTSPQFVLQGGSPLSSGASFSHVRLNETESIRDLALPNTLRYHLSAGTLQLFALSKNQFTQLELVDLSGRVLFSSAFLPAGEYRIPVDARLSLVVLRLATQKGEIYSLLIPSQP